jgi:hypothetical protein
VLYCPHEFDFDAVEIADMLPELGLAVGWKAGHEAVRAGALTLDGLDEADRDARLTAYAAEQARAYMRRIVAAHGLTPAQGVRLFAVYSRTFARGALDQALDGGALLGAN